MDWRPWSRACARREARSAPATRSRSTRTSSPNSRRLTRPSAPSWGSCRGGLVLARALLPEDAERHEELLVHLLLRPCHVVPLGPLPVEMGNHLGMVPGGVVAAAPRLFNDPPVP